MKTQVFPIEVSQHISLQRHFPPCEIAAAGLRETEQFSLPQLEQHCKQPVLVRTRKCSSYVCDSPCSLHHCFSEGETNPPSVPGQYVLHLEFWLGWHFLKYTYIFRVRQLPGDYYTAADAEGHKLFLQRSTLHYAKKLSSWPFILSWHPHCEQVMNFYDFTTSHWSYYVPLGETKWGGGKRPQTAYRHLKVCPFCFIGWHWTRRAKVPFGSCYGT